MTPSAMDSSPASESSTLDASPYGHAAGSPRHASTNWKAAAAASSQSPQDTLQASLEDALAQLEVARQQRTEVSAQLFKFRCAVDELREQKAQLQSELNRRLQTHKEDVDRIMSLQGECDTMRRTYNEKQAEIIELSTKIQGLMAKLESTEQYNELKEENELLWRRIEDLKKYEALEAAGELGGKESKWKERFASIEMALNEALEARRSVIGNFEIDNDDVNASVNMLTSILDAEEKMRRSVSSQMSTLRMELRTVKDSLAEMTKKAAESDVAAVKLDMEVAKLSDAQRRVIELEREREHFGAKTLLHQGEIETLRKDQADLRAQLVQAQSSLTHVTSERDALIRKQANEFSSAEVEGLRREKIELRVALSQAQAEADQLTSQNRDLEARLSSTLSEIKKKEAQLHQAEEVRESNEATLSILRSALDSEKAATRRAEAASALKDLEVERLEKRLCEETRLLDTERENTRAQKRDWDLLRTSLENRLREQQSEAPVVPPEQSEFLEERVTALRAQLKVKDAEVSRLEAKLADLHKFVETEREEFKERNEEWYATESRFEKELAALKKDKDSSTAKVNRELQALRKSLESQKVQYEDTISSYKGEIAELRRNLAQHEEGGGVESLQQALEESENAKRLLDEQVASQEEHIEHLEQQLQEQREAGHMLGETEDQNAHLKEKVESLETELAEIVSQKEELQSALEKAHEDIASELADVKKALESAKEDSIRVEKEREEERARAKQKVLELSSKVESLEARIEGDLNKNLKSLVVDSLKDLSPADQILRLKVCLQRLSGELKEKEALMAMFESRRNEYEQENKALQSQIKKVEEGWKLEYEGYLDHLSRVTTTLDRVNEEKKDLQDQLTKTKSALQSHVSSKRAASSGKLSPDTENSSTASTPTTNKEREALLREKKALEKSVEDLKKRCADIQAERDELLNRKPATQRSMKVAPSVLPVKKSPTISDMSTPRHLAVLLTACYIAYLTGSLAY